MKKTFDTLTQDKIEIIFRHILQNRSLLKDLYNEFEVPEDFVKRVLEKNACALKYISDELKTPELCKIAVEKNAWALKFVPKKYQHLFRQHKTFYDIINS